MDHSFIYLFIWLLGGIIFIILLTAKYKIPAFFALSSACFLVGLGAQMPLSDILNTMKEGFGNVMKSLGFIIVLGTTLGAVLEHNGSIAVLSDFIIRKMGEKYIVLSMNIIGFIVGMPVFCDSGFIILSSLNKSISLRTAISPYITSVSLATGLLSVHCLIPPHPGASAAAALLEVDFGKLLLIGTLIAIPASLAGYFWAIYAGRKFQGQSIKNENEKIFSSSQPSPFQSFLPIAVPVLLMSARSFSTWGKSSSGIWQNIFSALGEPVVALAIGILMALTIWKNKKIKTVTALLGEATEKAGGILVIIGAGGAFGAILTAMHFGQHFSKIFPLASMGILFPFLVTSLLKTAQGSSTVAIITAASLVQPLLPALHLDSENGRLLCLLSMGAGSMIISHANDAYFWVIAKFSSLAIKPMFRMYSLATLWMGLVSFGMVCILSLFLSH
ncbi:MAG TPA: GntP family permease [Puia sp.]|nr:GntP family permease [Puia sp.]